MDQALVVSGPQGLAEVSPDLLPALITNAGPQAALRFVEFFAAQLANDHTRKAYFRATSAFLTWCQEHPQIRIKDLRQIQPLHVAAYIDALKREQSTPTVKQHLAGIRHLFDWLVMGQVMPVNPASSVRAPKHVVRRGKTPPLSPEEMRQLIGGIDTSHVVGLRDRALIGAMVYTFGRVGAIIQMQVRDYYPKGKRWWVRLHEKGGKEHEMPAHHNLEGYLDEYITAGDLRDDPKGMLFRTTRGRTRVLSDQPMAQSNVFRMIQRRAKDAGIRTPIGCHTFRSTGITIYLKNGGTLENAQQMANHASARTTKVYDYREDEMTLDEVEKIMF